MQVELLQGQWKKRLRTALVQGTDVYSSVFFKTDFKWREEKKKKFNKYLRCLLFKWNGMWGLDLYFIEPKPIYQMDFTGDFTENFKNYNYFLSKNYHFKKE